MSKRPSERRKKIDPSPGGDREVLRGQAGLQDQVGAEAQGARSQKKNFWGNAPEKKPAGGPQIDWVGENEVLLNLGLLMDFFEALQMRRFLSGPRNGSGVFFGGAACGLGQTCCYKGEPSVAGTVLRMNPKLTLC